VPTLIAAPDKFRGTATAGDIARAMCEAATELGWRCIAKPVSDGGEGLLECYGGPTRVSTVTGPLGEKVDAPWRLDGTTAIIEMATASGLALVAGRNDPVAATTRGTGELIAAALDAGARDLVVGVGGSATTDGGLGAVEVLADRAPLDGVTVAADVTTRFVDAAAVFAPQKGADPATVVRLERRLHELTATYRTRFGVDVAPLPGSGAAGGLAGGLAALGASIRPGFDVVAEALGLPVAVAAADLVLTGEGRLDATSLDGKAPIGVARLCATARVPVVIVAGEIDDTVAKSPDFSVPAVSLSARIGSERARREPLPAVRDVVQELLRAEISP
jgi:glycerate 2-kinase